MKVPNCENGQLEVFLRKGHMFSVLAITTWRITQMLARKIWWKNENTGISTRHNKNIKRAISK